MQQEQQHCREVLRHTGVSTCTPQTLSNAWAGFCFWCINRDAGTMQSGPWSGLLLMFLQALIAPVALQLDSVHLSCKLPQHGCPFAELLLRSSCYVDLQERTQELRSMQ
jgi:hypothetical protein